jgi:DNA polymerase-4
MARYRRESARLFEVLETFTPQIEAVSVDEAFLDLTGCPLPAEPPAPSKAPHAPRGAAVELGCAFGEAIQRRIHATLSLPVSVGVAPNKFRAKVASELAKPDGVRRIMPHAVQAVLDPLPVEALWGVGPETGARLHARGITTIGALRRVPASVLRATLGSAADRLAALSRGDDGAPVQSGGAAKSIGRETTFDHDTRDRGALARTLRELCEDVAHGLRADGLTGRTVALKVRFAPFETVTRRTTLRAATDHGGRIAAAATELWARLDMSRAVRLVGVTVSALERPVAAQTALFDGSEPRELHRRVDRVVDAINERFGAGTVAPARVVDDPTGAERPARPRRRGPRPSGRR